ncbi:MAG: DUF368 domain-containing protein [Clostridia bacterium]|nr:DUF368 domain-containing protein [Clostridia bacterium]
MKIIIDVLRGILIGVANIIPGISGATIALSLGVYDKIIHCVNNIIKEFKKSILYLIPIGIGAVLGIAVFSKIIEFCFENFRLQTSFTFIGLILGSLPMLIKRVSGKKVTAPNVIALIIGAVFIAGFAFLTADTNAVSKLSNPILLILVGMIGAISMVIPGLSGSLVLTALGYYDPIISTINSFTSKALSFDIGNIWGEFFVLTFFGIGVIIGIVLFAKVIEFLFNKFETTTFYAIIGIILASPVALLININYSSFSLIAYIVSIILLALGFYVAVLLGDRQ